MTEQENKKCCRWKNIDLFSTPINFTYKKEGKYSTTIGGIVTFIYILLILAYLIFEFVYFVKRDKYEIVYLAENMDSTDILNFKQSKNDIAYRLEFKNNSNSSLTCEDLLDVKIKFIYSARNKTTGKRDKKPRDINTYNCKYLRQTNKFLKTNESSGIIYKCLDNLNETIRNVYNDDYFSYYEITVSLRDSEKDNFTNINDFLLINDCKIEVHYLDYTIKVENYKNPIVPYENSVFLQLSPVSILEMNAYFMKQILKDQRNVIFPTLREKTIENTVFSRVEQYSYYKGEDREKRKIQNDIDYKNYAKIFIRADTKKLNVQRHYQSLGRFWADNTQIFWDLFTFVNFFIGVAYNFLSYYSLSKKIFYFHDIDEKGKNFNHYPNEIKLKNIINAMDKVKEVQINKEELDLFNLNPKASMNEMNFKRKNNKKKINEKNTDFSDLDFKVNPPPTGNDTTKESSSKSAKNGCCSYGFCDLYYKCCMKCRNNYPNYLKATKMITDKLDIVLYVRNTILLDIISKTVIGNNRENIVQFLSIPVVSLKEKFKNENEKNNIFVENTNKYRPYLKEDFESCEKEIAKLADKEEKGELDKNLILYIKKQNEELKNLNES